VVDKPMLRFVVTQLCW